MTRITKLNRKQVQEIIKAANKNDIWGWKIREITNDHLDLEWNYGVCFRISFDGDEGIICRCDYGYGWESDMVETFKYMIIGEDWYADINDIDNAVPVMVGHTIAKARVTF